MKYQWLLTKKMHTFPSAAYTYSTIFSSVICQHTVDAKKKKKENKWCFQQSRNLSNQSLLSHPAFLTTKCEFFGEYDLWHSKEKCFTSEQMSLLRCHSSVFQYGQDGSVLEVHDEKILCPEKIVSVLALWCWRREVLRLEKVSWLPSPVERQRRARPGLYVCNTSFYSMLKMFLSLCLQWVLPCPRCYQHCHMLLFFFGWFRYCCPLLALLFPHFFAGQRAPPNTGINLADKTVQNTLLPASCFIWLS